MPHIIEQYSSNKHYLDADIQRTVNAVKAVQCHGAYPVPIDMNSFKRDFASLLAVLEKSAMVAEKEHTTQVDTEVAASELPTEDNAAIEATKSIIVDRHSKIAVGIGSLITVTGAIGVQGYKALKSSYSRLSVFWCSFCR